MKYRQEADWWSLGVVLYEMVVNRNLFSGRDEDEIYNQITRGDHYKKITINVHAQMISFMKKLLHRDPKKRLAYRYKPNYINPLNSEPFFIQGSKLIENMEPPIEITYMADDETADTSDQIYYNKIRKKRHPR